MSILPLPEDVRAQIKSSIEITSLLDVVEGLFKNALDAGATNVNITVDFAKGFCSVKDDGVGIKSAEFIVGGRLAQLYCTSKVGTLSYGSHGRFLFCLSSLSLLSVSSRHRSESKVSSALLQQGSVISRQVERMDEEFASCGTEVVVHNLFGKIPVRFKQQAARSSDATANERQFETLQHLLVSYLLAFGKPINLRLSSNDQSLRYTCLLRDGDEERRMSLQKISRIFRRAGLSIPSDTWKLASAQAGEISVRAAICLTPQPSKRAQFVSFSQDPVPARVVASVIYDTINSVFESSVFGTIEDAGKGRSSRPSSRKNPEYNQSTLQARLIKAVDRWPAFYVRIESKSQSTLPAISQSLVPDDGLSTILQEILSLVKLLLKQFLQTHQLRPKHVRTERRNLVTTAAPSRRPGENGAFDQWRRMKSAFPVTSEDICSGLPFVGPYSAEDAVPDEDVRLLLKDIELDPGIVEDNPALQDNPSTTNDAEDDGCRLLATLPDGDRETVPWMNPRTGKILQLDPRNGCVAALEYPNHQSSSCPATGPSNRFLNPSRRLPSRPSTRAELADRLQIWPSSTFSSKPEAPIPSLVVENGHQDLDNSGIGQKIEAVHLATAHVLRQVDSKFILASMPTSMDGTKFTSLVLIDQHAADERIKVEEYYQQLCSGNRVSLARPIVFDISGEEAKCFNQAQAYFTSWGLDYDVRCQNPQRPTSESQTSIAITDLPTMIAERCRLEPRILIEMLRREIWSKDSVGCWNPPHVPNDSWISRISHCPDGLVEMVNSRACRSAIMFNDVLTNDQCQELLRRLSRCSLPFQCAHGRPNITVLIAFGQDDGFGLQHQENESFGKAFKHWSS